MVKNQRWQNPKEVEALVVADEHYRNGINTPPGLFSRSKSKQLCFAFIFLFSCCLILASLLLLSSPASTFSLSNHSWLFNVDPGHVTNGTIYCDRSGSKSDVCRLTGDIRTDSISSSITVYTNNYQNTDSMREKIRPYTRKWETDLMMKKVSELDLVVKNHSLSFTKPKCDVNHGVPAVFFSSGGYTGNVYHDIHDVILPLYITSQHFKKKVVFMIPDYRDWWVEKYSDVLSVLSDYPVIDFKSDNRTHCFPESIVGLKFHDGLAVDPSLMEENKTIVDFHNLLDRAYWPRIRGLTQAENREKMVEEKQKPRLALISRKGSREISNEDALVIMAKKIGFSVTVLRPEKTTEANIYMVLNSSDVLVGVHGAAMTYFLFMRPGSALVQIIPLGTDWAAGLCFGEPSVKYGLRYIGYKILAKESSLYHEYGKNHPILIDPDSATSQNWELTKKIYFDHQNVSLNLPRFRKRLVHAYQYIIDSKRH